MADFSSIVRAVQQDDSEAVAELIRLMSPMLLKYSMIGDVKDDDLMQYLIIRMLKATKDFNL